MQEKPAASPKVPTFFSRVDRAMCLATIFYESKAVLVGYAPESGHVCRLSIDVHCKDAGRSAGDPFFNAMGVNKAGLRVNIGKYGHSAVMKNT